MGTARAVTTRGWSRSCSGALTAGLAVLLAVLLGCWAGSAAAGTPGPGLPMLVGHAVAVGLALALQRVADRRADRVGLLAAGGVLAVTVLVGVLFWWG